MGLSRLDNFLKSTRGTILYVDPNSLDATDSIENQGNSLTRPFKTIQRALIEAARFSYQRGLNNDRFAKTTILFGLFAKNQGSAPREKQKKSIQRAWKTT